jgi:hypothetical protein
MGQRQSCAAALMPYTMEVMQFRLFRPMSQARHVPVYALGGGCSFDDASRDDRARLDICGDEEGRRSVSGTGSGCRAHAQSGARAVGVLRLNRDVRERHRRAPHTRRLSRYEYR